MREVTAAAIYARISSDQGGDGLGVKRQLEDCYKLASDRCWTVHDEYVDNDVSAFSGKRRPNYERMLSDIGARRVDAVLVYHLDRLTRRPIELERFIDVCTLAGIDVTTVTGDVGLGNDNGLLVARITSAMAAAESGRKSARIKRKILQNVQMGKPNGGGQRPFGYEWDRVTVRETEATIIRRLVSRYIAGESLNSLVRWMNAAGIPTTGKAGSWKVQAIRQIVAGGRIAGIRDHLGSSAGDASWPAIITRAQHDAVLAMIASKQVTRAAPRLSLLSGMLRCGRCGNKLFAATSRGIRRYACMARPGTTGCGRVSANAGKLEEAVAAAVLVRLDSAGFASLLKNHASTDPRRTQQIAAVQQAEATLIAMAEMLGRGELSEDEFKAARRLAWGRRDAAVRELDESVGFGALRGLDSRPSERFSSWSHVPFDRQRGTVKALLENVTLRPGPPSRTFDSSRLEFRWVREVSHIDNLR